MSATLPRCSRNQLLHLSQSGGPNAEAAQDRVVEVFGDKLKELTARTCRRYCLHHQERDDVLAETYQQLFNPKIVRFAEYRGEPEHYFRGLVQNAARKIMVALRKHRKLESLLRANWREDSVVPGTDTLVKRLQPHAEPLSPAKQAEMRDTIVYILDHAPPRLTRALRLCYWGDWPLQRIAEHLGMSRFALAREIQRFFAKIKMDFE